MNSTLTWLWGRLPLPRRARTSLIWLLTPKFTVGVVGLVRDDEGRVLLFDALTGAVVMDSSTP